MILSARLLNNVIDINNFDIDSSVVIFEGQPNSIYFQIISYKNKIRYITSASVYSVTATFPDIDPVKQFTLIATQPFSDDKSIYKVDVSSTQYPNSGIFLVNFTEDGITKVFKVETAVSVKYLNQGGC